MSAELSRQRKVPWAWLLVAALAGLLALVGVGYVARDPRRRRRALRRVGTTWLAVENVASRGTRPLQRRRTRIAREARRIVGDATAALEALPIAWSRTAIPPVVNQFYGHGAFMGAAPELLRDDGWRRILAFLMPDVYADVREAVLGGAAPGAIIPMFENNPVMCAFGVWRGVKARAAGAVAERGPHDLAGHEWDVFLAGDLVEAWEDAAEEGRPAIAGKVVDCMVIAHASTADTVQEQIGLCQWGDVRKTPKTRLGGVEPRAWMDLFARALRLAQAEDLASALGTMSLEPRLQSHLACLDHTFAEPLSFADAVAVYRRLTGWRFSVVLEIKSMRITAALLGALVRELNRREIHVAAIGSFLVEEIRGVSAIAQEVGGEVLPGPREIVLLHFAGDLKLACDRGLVGEGASAMFNGASLILARPEAGRFVYEIDPVTLGGLEDYQQRFGLHLGIYVQEHDCDAAAASLLSELVRARPATFELGFAWGGVLDEVSIEAGLGDHRGFGGQRVLQRLGYGPAWRRT